MTSIRRWFGVKSRNGPRKLRWSWAIVSVALILPLAASAAPQWRVLETPRFTVVSQLSEKETRAWVEEFNQFVEALKGVIRVDERFLPKLTVVMFAREKDFAPFRPIGKNGKVQEWVAGYFSRQEAWGVIGMADGSGDEVRHIIFHEGVHWMVSTNQNSYPLWFNEGLAELFSNFRIEEGKAVFGDVIDDHVTLLRRERTLPIQRLMSVSSADPLFNESDRTGIFYAQSWAFVHYLVCGQRKGGQGSVIDFLNSYFGGMSNEVALQKTFGMDFEAMDDALKEYLERGRFFISNRPMPETAKITAAFQPATPACVQVALSRLAFGTGLLDKAKQHAREAIRLDPNYALGYTMLAWSLQYEEELDQFLEAAGKAVQLGATDAESLALLAQAKYKKAYALGGLPPAEARQIANMLERAVEIAPSMKSAYCNLANALVEVDKIDKKDLDFLVQGKQHFPEEPVILIGVINILRKHGMKEDAAKVMEKVLSQPDKLGAEQLKHLREMKSSWDVEQTTRQAADLMEQEDYKGAVALLDALNSRAPLLQARGFIIQQRNQALAFATLQDADRARDEGRKGEAVQLYERIMAMRSVPPYVQGRAEQELRKLKGADSTATDSSGDPGEK